MQGGTATGAEDGAESIGIATTDARTGTMTAQIETVTAAVHTGAMMAQEVPERMSMAPRALTGGA
ncbi:MAG TPA: hypothetical protein VKA90_06480 [Beijerinckiaceae bacterium]|nr:hypothetical protein [Beijerinckiaceae bacterium]